MAHYSHCRFPVPEARRLASLESIRQDVLGVLEYCDRCDQMREVGFDGLLWEALGAAAVVRYARCFSPGARDPLSHGMLDAAPSSVRESHEYFIAVRSKHVAHSVNAFEDNDVTVTIRSDGTSLEIQGIGAHHGRVLGLAFQDPARLRKVCQWLLAEVTKAIESEKPVLLEVAKRYGPEAILAFGVPQAGTAVSDLTAKRGRPKP